MEKAVGLFSTVMRFTSVKGRPIAPRLCHFNLYIIMAETCCGRCIHNVQNSVFVLAVKTAVV
jgi:hypothetical protein